MQLIVLIQCRSISYRALVGNFSECESHQEMVKANSIHHHSPVLGIVGADMSTALIPTIHICMSLQEINIINGYNCEIIHVQF